MSLIGEGEQSAFTGVWFTAAIVLMLVQHQYQEVTGRRPRPVVRARWRRQAAEIAQTLSGTPVGRERMNLRQRAEALGREGSRLTDRAAAQSWRTALSTLPPRRRAAVVASISLPVVLVAWPASHGPTSDSLPAYAGCSRCPRSPWPPMRCGGGARVARSPSWATSFQHGPRACCGKPRAPRLRDLGRCGFAPLQRTWGVVGPRDSIWIRRSGAEPGRSGVAAWGR